MSTNKTTKPKKPAMTEREASYRVAQAGIAAAKQAEAAGGDPDQIRALGKSARPPRLTEIAGHALHGLTLQVSLCLSAYAVLFGREPNEILGAYLERAAKAEGGNAEPNPAELRAFMHLGFILCDPFEAFEPLDDLNGLEDAERKHAFDQAARQFCAGWGGKEAGELITYFYELGKSAAGAAAPPA